MADGAELEVVDHAFQARQAAFEVGVVAEAGEPAGVGDARLVRVYLPGVEVENLRFGLVETGAFEQPARQGVGVLAKVAAAGGRYGLPEYLGGGEREFRQSHAFAGNNGVGRFGAAGDTVVVVAGREDAGVPGETQLREDIQRPQRFAGN